MKLQDQYIKANKVKESYQGVREETLQDLISDRDKFKTLYQKEIKKNNDAKIAIESQKRLIERTNLENVTGFGPNESVLSKSKKFVS